MVIGVMGLEFGSGNKGCEALGFSFLSMVDTIAKELDVNFEVKIGIDCDIDRIYKELNCSNLSLSCFSLGKITEVKRKINTLKKMDVIYDFTAGDSFSDIYGLKRFLRWTMNKQCVIFAKKSLILGSQTYGPYKRVLSIMWACHIMKKAYRVYARDDISKKVVEKMSKRDDICKTVDVAFALPYDKDKYHVQEKGKIKIGFNPSGLLWAGGYNGKNQFSLKLDYQKYCIELIENLYKSGKYDVYLIPHVLYNDLSCVDNDIIACNALRERFPGLIVSPWFDTPMDAKSYISNMDIFIGSRMHATIAAFTSGVVTIPVSYSRKFEGLFNSIGYPYVVSGTECTTAEALSSTVLYIEDIEHLSQIVTEKQSIVTAGTEQLLSSIKADIVSVR